MMLLTIRARMIWLFPACFDAALHADHTHSHTYPDAAIYIYRTPKDFKAPRLVGRRTKVYHIVSLSMCVECRLAVRTKWGIRSNSATRLVGHMLSRRTIFGPLQDKLSLCLRMHERTNAHMNRTERTILAHASPFSVGPETVVEQGSFKCALCTYQNGYCLFIIITKSVCRVESEHWPTVADICPHRPFNKCCRNGSTTHKPPTPPTSPTSSSRSSPTLGKYDAIWRPTHLVSHSHSLSIPQSLSLRPKLGQNLSTL